MKVTYITIQVGVTFTISPELHPTWLPRVRYCAQ